MQQALLLDHHAGIGMAQAWGVRRWNAVYQSLEVREQPHLKALPKPTDESLDRFEEESDFQLPRSYRTFIKVFGPGELAWEYRFVAPGYPRQPEAIDLVRFNEDTKKRFTKQFLRLL